MNKYLSTMISAALAASVAHAGDQQYDKNRVEHEAKETAAEIERSTEHAADEVADATRDVADDIERGVDNAADEIDDTMDRAAYNADDYSTTSSGFENMTAEEMDDVKVVLRNGDEIGEIDEVGYSASHGEKVAVVEIGGFLGIGERDIAVPVSQLKRTSDGRAILSMTRQQLEAAPEFDDDWLEDAEEAE